MTLPFLLCSRSSALLLHQALRDSQCSPCSFINPTAGVLSEQQRCWKHHSCIPTPVLSKNISTSVTLPQHPHSIAVGYRSDQLFNLYTCPAQADRDLNSASDKEAAAEGGQLWLIGINGTVHNDLLITQKSGRGTDMRLPWATHRQDIYWISNQWQINFEILYRLGEDVQASS